MTLFLEDELRAVDSYAVARFPVCCTPYRAVYRGPGGPKLFLVHHVDCTQPRLARQTTSFPIPEIVATHLRKQRLKIAS